MESLTFYIMAGAVYLFSLAVQGKLKRTYARWSEVRNSSNSPGAHVARDILDANEMRRVQVEEVAGKLSDHYDPRSKVIRLSPPVYGVPSVAAMAISAHESGHAIQDHQRYGPLKFRTAAAPVANLAGRFGIPAAILGSFVGSGVLVQVGVLAYVGALLLQFLTLPVEFNASKRALGQLERLQLMSDEEREGAQKVLRALRRIRAWLRRRPLTRTCARYSTRSGGLETRRRCDQGLSAESRRKCAGHPTGLVWMSSPILDAGRSNPRR